MGYDKGNEERDGHAIVRPARRLMTRVPLDFVRRHVTGIGGRPVNASLNLTAFIDFMIVVLVFLLMTFSASGDVGDPGVEVPQAENVMDVLEAPMVVVSTSQVRLNGDLVEGTTTTLDAGGVRKLDVLFEGLVAIKRQWRSLNPNGKPFHGICLLQIDEAVPAHVVKSVFRTVTLAGYPDVSFVVRRRS